MPEIKLPPIKESTEDFDKLEARILELFKKEIYFPLMKELNLSNNTLQNSLEDLLKAIASGRVVFSQGEFSGKFSAQITKELRALGAKWDNKNKSFKLLAKNLPSEIRMAISVSDLKLKATFQKIDHKLAQMVPEKIAEKLQAEKLFDTTLFKTDKKLEETIKGITVSPKLTPDRRARIAREYTENMRLYIKDFTEKEIVKLRKRVQESALKGGRHEELVDEIQSSFSVSRNKAKFLARQETSLLMTKFKQDRYEDAGVNYYIWKTVAGSKNHPVRPWHKALENKKFKWSDPPITTKPGEPIRKNNPGQDYNCRCYAIPVVNF